MREMDVTEKSTGMEWRPKKWDEIRRVRCGGMVTGNKDGKNRCNGMRRENGQMRLNGLGREVATQRRSLMGWEKWVGQRTAGVRRREKGWDGMKWEGLYGIERADGDDDGIFRKRGRAGVRTWVGVWVTVVMVLSGEQEVRGQPLHFVAFVAFRAVLLRSGNS